MFTWKPLYAEIANRVLTFEKDQAGLLNLMRQMKSQGLAVMPLNDRGADEQYFALQEIDPFTFFSNFNRKLTDSNRRQLLEAIKKAWVLKSSVPDDFDGIPVAHPQKAWFFAFKPQRSPGDIPKLWRLAREAMTKNAQTFDRAILEDCIAIAQVGLPKLTMGMFWLNPGAFLAVDQKNRKFVAKQGIELAGESADAYFKFLAEVASKFGTDFASISRMAWESAHEPPPPPPPGPVIEPSNSHFWWLNANPKIWDFSKVAVGEKVIYTSHNESGNKRQRYACFEEAKPGDLLVGYITSPQREVVALCRITKGLHESPEGAGIEFEKIEQLAKPIPFELLENHTDLKKCEPVVSHQGSLFRLTKEEFQIIRGLADTGVSSTPSVASEPYTATDALEELFLSETQFRQSLKALEQKQNIVLQGPPGVGKTFVAERLAYAFMNCRDQTRLAKIQFHQSYSYEDFIQGYRPADNGEFSLKNGVFYEFCRKAQADQARKWVFIIDEINRGNLSKIFGELMLLVEPDKRGERHAVPLTYSAKPFFVPENVFVIGTMNTADRSLALVDYALRRRFRFITLRPEFDSPKFRKHLEDSHAAKPLLEKIIKKIKGVNEVIASDKDLGEGYKIGHSYFCPRGGVTLDEAWYQDVIELEIVPLLEEYWFDDRDKVEQQKAVLLA